MRISHVIEYALVRVLETAAGLLPRPVALAFGGAFGMILYRCGVYRRIVDRNMRHTELWDDAQMRAITKRLYRMMGRYIVDFLLARPGKLPHDLTDRSFFDNARERGKGTLVVLGHYGNWEALAAIFGRTVPSFHAVAMPMKNPLVERWLNRKRSATGAIEISKSKALRKIIAALRANSLTAVLVDQNARRQGIDIPFLGKPASTVRTVGGMVQHTGCSVLFVYGTLEEDGRYHVHMENGREPAGVSRDDSDGYATAWALEHNEIISRWIRERPEHWFGWFHRRFAPYLSYR